MSTSLLRFEEKFPQLHFLLHLLKGQSWTLCQEGKNAKRSHLFLHREEGIEDEISAAFSKIHLEEVETCYIYGIGLGHYATYLLDWLKKDIKRDLVFLEDDIEVLRLFLKTNFSQKLIEHPQIHFHFMLDRENWQPFLEERADQFPYDQIAFIALESYKKKEPKRVADMALYLLRRTTIYDAIHKDGMYYHVLSKNVLRNFSHIQTAFYVNRFQDAFKNIPAVICGAGPSLQKELEKLRQLEDRALVFAGGSAAVALSHAGILPHFNVAIDPNFEEVKRFNKSYAFEVPLLYTNRLHPDVFKTFNGPHGYIHAKTGGPLEAWWEEELGIEPLPLKEGFDLEALSVTTTSLELATTMGCNPIYLVGVDLAFTNNALYAQGIIENNQIAISDQVKQVSASEQLLKKKDRHGNLIYTLVKWVMESEAISRFAKHHDQTTYINSTSGGIGFPDLPYQPFSVKNFKGLADLRGKIHQLIEMNRFTFKKTDPLKKLTHSLQKARELTYKALKELDQIKHSTNKPESGRMILFQMELEELLAYRLCLKEPERTFQKTFNRLNRPSSFELNTQEKWNFLYSKWKNFNELIIYYLDSSFTK